MVAPTFSPIVTTADRSGPADPRVLLAQRQRVLRVSAAGYQIDPIDIASVGNNTLRTSIDDLIADMQAPYDGQRQRVGAIVAAGWNQVAAFTGANSWIATHANKLETWTWVFSRPGAPANPNARVQLRRLRYQSRGASGVWQLRRTAKHQTGNLWINNANTRTYLPLKSIDSEIVECTDATSNEPLVTGVRGEGPLGDAGYRDCEAWTNLLDDIFGGNAGLRDVHQFAFCVDARMVLNDPNGIDDRAALGATLSLGFDWWEWPNPQRSTNEMDASVSPLIQGERSRLDGSNSRAVAIDTTGKWTRIWVSSVEAFSSAYPPPWSPTKNWLTPDWPYARAPHVLTAAQIRATPPNLFVE